MTTEDLQSIVPRCSWWKDKQGRSWVITGYTLDTKHYLPSQLEMLLLYETVPVYVCILAFLTSMENGSITRI